jgi:hypothetical protein
MSVRPKILALAAGLALSIALSVHAQQPPPPAVLTLSSSPDDAAQKAIAAFIDPNLQKIASGTPEEVQNARKALASVLRKPECTLVFYRTFLQLATPAVEGILKSGDSFRATNALLVIRQVKASEAFSMVLAQATAASQPDLRIRVAASSMVGAMIRGGAVPPTELDGASRRIRESISEENNSIAASQLIDALGAVGTAAESAKLPEQARGAFQELIASAGAMLDRAEKPATSDFAMPTFRALVAIRDMLVKLPADRATNAGKALEPLLNRVKAMPAAPAGADPSVQREIDAAKSAVAGIEGMVGLAKPEPARK